MTLRGDADGSAPAIVDGLGVVTHCTGTMDGTSVYLDLDKAAMFRRIHPIGQP